MQPNPAKSARTRCILLAVFLLVFNVWPAPGASPPANDSCAGAVLIPANGPFPYLTPTIPDMRLATAAGDPSPSTNCAIDATRGVWYSFTPGSNALYTFSTSIDTATTLLDPVMAIYTSANGCAGPFVEKACNDDAGGLNNRAGMATNLNAGTTYYIVIWVGGATDLTDTNATFALQLRVDQPVIPANDTCSGAEVVPSSGPFPYASRLADTTRATTTAALTPSCFQASSDPLRKPSRDVWYQFTPATAGTYIFSTGADTQTTVDDTIMALYTNTSPTSCSGSFMELACSDNTIGRASFSPTLSAGTRYYLVVWENYDDYTVGETLSQLRVSPATAPSVTTLPVSSIASTGAVVNGIVNANGLQSRFWFEWGPTTGLGSTSQVKFLFAGTTTFPTNVVLSGLQPDITYRYRLVATNMMGMNRGEENRFVWSTTRPTLGSAQRLQSGNFRFQFMGNPNQLYVIQSATTLGSAPAWSDLGLATNLSSTLFQFTHTGAAVAPYRYYRLRLP